MSAAVTQAVVLRKLDKVPEKAQKRAQKGPPSCPHSGKSYTDLSHSERLHRQFTCGDCGTRFPLPETDAKAEQVQVPPHQVPAALHEYRKMLERNGQ